MTRITGYARQNEPKWFHFSVIILAVIVISAALYAFFAVYSWMESESLNKLQAETVSTTTIAIIASAESTTTTTTTMLIAANAAVAVDKIVFSSGISESNQPVDDLSEISLKESRPIYCHTRVNCSVVPTVIRHVWINPSGTVAADIELPISRRPADTWSYSSQPGTKPGKWEFQVRTVKDEVVARRGFLTY